MVIMEQKFHTMTIIVIKNVKVMPIAEGRKVRVMATSTGVKCKIENDGNNCS
jgi:hypothetical protein